MTYSASDFADEVTARAAELGLLMPQEIAAIEESEDPAAAAAAVLRALDAVARYRKASERVAHLNPKVAEIGAGMLATIVQEARDAIATEPRT